MVGDPTRGAMSWSELERLVMEGEADAATADGDGLGAVL